MYKSHVKITFKDRVADKVIVAKKNNYLVTLDKEFINIDEIVDIVKI